MTWSVPSRLLQPSCWLLLLDVLDGFWEMVSLPFLRTKKDPGCPIVLMEATCNTTDVCAQMVFHHQIQRQSLAATPALDQTSRGGN